jgi:GNAT superfamily N-acetyltransferase
MTSLRIRPALKKDLKEILELYKGLTDDPDDKISLNAAIRKFNKLQRFPYYKLFVAEYNNEIAGTFALLIMDNLAHRGEPSSIIEDVVVKSSLRGQKIGRAMMSFAMEISRRKGCYKMVLSSHLRRVNAHRFYESLGFKKHGFSFVVSVPND